MGMTHLKVMVMYILSFLNDREFFDWLGYW